MQNLDERVAAALAAVGAGDYRGRRWPRPSARSSARLEETLAGSGRSPEEVLQAIRRAVALYEGGGPPHDDPQARGGTPPRTCRTNGSLRRRSGLTFADRRACGVRTLVTVMLLAGVPHTGCMASRSVQNRLEHADFVERAFIRKEVTEPGVVQVVYEAHHHSGQTSDGPLWTFGVQAGCESTDARVWSDDSWVEVELGAPPLELRRRNESLDYEAARELARGAGGVSRARHGCFVFMVPYDDEEPEAAHRWPFATHPDYFSTAILHVEPQEPPPRLAAAAAGALFLDLATFPIQVLLAPAWFALQ